jgi:hypothetical protein
MDAETVVVDGKLMLILNLEPLNRRPSPVDR